MAKLTKDQKTSLKAVFDNFDTDGSGALNASELCKAMATNNVHLTVKKVEEIIKKRDTDNNGSLEFEEFLEMYADVQRSHKDPHKDLRDAFHQFDLDKNGKLSKEEFSKIMVTIGDMRLTEDEFDDLMQKVDKNGDGEIDVEEYIEFICGE